MTIDEGAFAPVPAQVDPIDTDIPDQLGFIAPADEQEVDAAEPPSELLEEDPVEEDPVETTDSADAVLDPVCQAYAAVWIQAEVFVSLRFSQVPNLGEIGASLLADVLQQSRGATGQDGTLIAMSQALVDLRTLVSTEFHYDWTELAATEGSADHPAAVAFEAEHDATARFITSQCPEIDLADLAAAAADATRTLDQNLRRLSIPVEPSDSIEGYSTYQRSSGRFEVSFPSDWERFEVQYGPLVEFVASPRPDAFLDGAAVDGVHIRVIRMFEAGELDALVAASRAATTCTAVGAADDAAASALVRTNYDCGDHQLAVLVGFNEARRTGVIVEATFGGPGSSGPAIIDTIVGSLSWGSIPG